MNTTPAIHTIAYAINEKFHNIALAHTISNQLSHLYHTHGGDINNPKVYREMNTCVSNYLDNAPHHEQLMIFLNADDRGHYNSAPRKLRARVHTLIMNDVRVLIVALANTDTNNKDTTMPVRRDDIYLFCDWTVTNAIYKKIPNGGLSGAVGLKFIELFHAHPDNADLLTHAHAHTFRTNLITAVEDQLDKLPYDEQFLLLHKGGHGDGVVYNKNNSDETHATLLSIILAEVDVLINRLTTIITEDKN